jgi:pimeloyl-ACP methyl ester carboxylesterase
MPLETSPTLPGQTLPVNGLELYYEEAGAGAPLLMLHGGTATGRSWYPYLPALQPHFRVILPDSRGHGRTNNPAGVLSYRRMADDIAALVQALGLTRPFIFGYSDGGQIALELGLRYPDLAGALILGGATYHFSPAYYAAVNAFPFIHQGAVDLDGLVRGAPEWAAELQADHGRPDDPDHWKTLLQQIVPLWLAPLDYTLADLSAITAPTLLLVGDRDEGVPVEQAVEMYRAIPHAALAVLPNADHGSAGWLPTGPNPLFTASVLSFLQRLPPLPPASSQTGPG